MAISSEYKEYLLDQLEPFGSVTIRRMFGGAGIFRDGLMFALVADDTLYFKVGEDSQPDFEDRGMGPFTYLRNSKPASLRYYEVPADVLEDPQELLPWAQKAFDVALSAARKKSPGKARRKAAR